MSLVLSDFVNLPITMTWSTSCFNPIFVSSVFFSLHGVGGLRNRHGELRARNKNRIASRDRLADKRERRRKHYRGRSGMLSFRIISFFFSFSGFPVGHQPG